MTPTHWAKEKIELYKKLKYIIRAETHSHHKAHSQNSAIQLERKPQFLYWRAKVLDHTFSPLTFITTTWEMILKTLLAPESQWGWSLQNSQDESWHRTRAKEQFLMCKHQSMYLPTLGAQCKRKGEKMPISRGILVFPRKWFDFILYKPLPEGLTSN